MAIEYLHDCIRASSGEAVGVSSTLLGDLAQGVTAESTLELWGGSEILYKAKATAHGDHYIFTIPEEITLNLHGRYFYTISDNNSSLCFRQPIYLI